MTTVNRMGARGHPLFDGFVYFHCWGDASGEIGFHADCGALQAVYDEVDEGVGGSDLYKCLLYT